MTLGGLSAPGALSNSAGPQPAPRSVWPPTSSFRGRTTSAISIPPPQQIPSKWPLRKLLSALPRRTSPWAPRSARVRHPEPASSATTRDHDNRHAMQRSCKNQDLSLTTCPSRRARLRRCPYLRLLQRHLRPRHRSLVRLNNTRPRVCEFERICGHWHFRKMVQRLTWVIPVAVRPSPVSPVA